MTSSNDLADPSGKDSEALEEKKPTESTKKKKRSSSKSEGKKKKSETIEWDNNGESFGTDNWKPQEFGNSPSTWDPKELDQQTSAMDSWKESNEPNRVQDLPSPTLDPDEDERKTNGEDDEWPFKSPCAFKEKNRRKLTPRSGHKGDSSDIDSAGEPSPSSSKRRSKKSGDSKSKFVSGAGGDSAPAAIRHEVSKDDHDSGAPVEAWKMRESWKSSSHTESSELSVSERSSKSNRSSSRKSKKKDVEPAIPKRGRGSKRDEDSDHPTTKPKTRDDEETDGEVVTALADEDQTKKPKRRSARSSSKSKEEELPTGSFHKLAKDFDKKPSSRSSSRSRKNRAPGSAGSGRRRRLKNKEMDLSGHSAASDDADEFGEEEHEIELKGGEDDEPGSGSTSRRKWRERRAQTRTAREREETSGADAGRAPGSAGRRPGGRKAVSRSSSERWKRTVEDGVEADAEVIERRARNALKGASTELSRSAHGGVRRYHSGGVGRMADGLGRSSYHGSSRTPMSRTPDRGRRTPRKPLRTPDASADEDFDEYEMNLSGRSARTLDSIEDLEDFGTMDFQTPGMIDYDEDIHELMQRANPEHTAQLNRRVHRKRDAVNYDQDMPMMTRQALLTRTASTQVMRKYLDQSNLDHRRLLVRTDSMSSMASNDELSASNHGLRGGRTPGRRPPPRTKSSGMAAIGRGDVPGFMNQPPRPSEPDRRGIFRTKSTTTHSFRQYQNKPNRIASLARNAPPDHSLRSTMHGEPSRGVRRNHSTAGALQRAHRSVTPTKPERRVPKSVDTKMASPKRPKPEATREDDSSISEDSDVESDGEKSPRKVSHLSPHKTAKPTPVKAAPPTKKPTGKRDFTFKGNRRILHSMLYEAKMGVDMKDLFKQVQKGETPKSPIKSLMMPSP